MTTNGTDKLELPERYEQYAAQHVRQQMTVLAERDALATECAKLKADIVLFRVEVEARQSELSEMRSREETAMLMRDKAIGERAKWEALFVLIQAQLNAFEVPAAPLVTEAT